MPLREYHEVNWRDGAGRDKLNGTSVRDGYSISIHRQYNFMWWAYCSDPSTADYRSRNCWTLRGAVRFIQESITELRGQAEDHSLYESVRRIESEGL